MNNIIFTIKESGAARFWIDTDSGEDIAQKILEEQEKEDSDYKDLPLYDLMDIIQWSCAKAGYQALFMIDR